MLRAYSGGEGPQIDKHLPPSTFTGQFFKKSRHLGLGVFIDIWSMGRRIRYIYLIFIIYINELISF
jgi:hypothetical protein